MKSISAESNYISSLVGDFRKPKSSVSVYLNSAAESLFLSSHVQAFEVYASCKSSGSEGRRDLSEIENQTKDLAAQLIGVDAQDVVFLSSTSRCIDVVIKSIDWKEGDNIVFSDTEFLTTEFAGALLRRSKIEIRLVESDDGYLSPEHYESRIDERTRLVVASSVSYKTGLILDVEGLSKIVHAKGSMLFIDGIQGLGSVPTSAASTDFFASGTFKWLFGMHGVSIFYVSPKILDRLKIPYLGYHSVSKMFEEDRTSKFELWPDARRFQEGLPNYAGICVLKNSLQAIHGVGINTIIEANRELTTLLLSEIGKMDLKVFGLDKVNQHSPIVSFENENFEKIGQGLHAAGIVVWAKDGRVRISPHFYNTEEDIFEFIMQLKKLI